MDLASPRAAATKKPAEAGFPARRSSEPQPAVLTIYFLSALLAAEAAGAAAEAGAEAAAEAAGAAFEAAAAGAEAAAEAAGAAAEAGAEAGAASSFLPQAARARAAIMEANNTDFFI